MVWPKVMKKLCGLLFMAGFLIIMFLGAAGQDDGRVCKIQVIGNRAENEKAVGRLVREILEIKINILKSEMLEIGIEVPAVETEVSAIETEKDLEKMAKQCMNIVSRLPLLTEKDNGKLSVDLKRQRKRVKQVVWICKLTKMQGVL